MDKDKKIRELEKDIEWFKAEKSWAMARLNDESRAVRERFAAAALTGMAYKAYLDPDQLAPRAYTIASAMMAKRKELDEEVESTNKEWRDQIIAVIGWIDKKIKFSEAQAEHLKKTGQMVDYGSWLNEIELLKETRHKIESAIKGSV